MNGSYFYDVFISFSYEDIDKARSLHQRLTDFGLKVFLAEKALEPGKPFPDELQRAVLGSEYFLLYFSESAAKSAWVQTEWTLFHTQCYLKDPEHRRIYILLKEGCPEHLIPALLTPIHRPRSDDHILTELIKINVEKLKRKITELEGQLDEERRKLNEARNYYRYSRFWRPIADRGAVYLFTCGRDIQDDLSNLRGSGGRTNIDVWDYRAVLDITHFFASRYPGVKITIADPTSKLHNQDLEHPGHLADRIAQMRSQLEDKDCIIVGSPDVSDFAEIVLAQIHRMDPYTEGRVKQNGFVIIKEKKYTKSSFYWQKKEDEKEGVAQITGEGDRRYFGNEAPSKERGIGKMYGILIVANNPFRKTNVQRKIVILSGISGIATNAIAKILTEETYLQEFFKLDNKYLHLDRNIEALIGVEYLIDRNSENRDTRQIKQITFEDLVEI